MTTNDEPLKRPRGRPRKPKPENPEPRRPRGRPSLGDDAKVHNISIRLSDNEYQLWKRLASEQGMTLADFVTAPLRKALGQKKGKQ